MPGKSQDAESNEQGGDVELMYVSILVVRTRRRGGLAESTAKHDVMLSRHVSTPIATYLPEEMRFTDLVPDGLDEIHKKIRFSCIRVALTASFPTKNDDLRTMPIDGESDIV